MGVAVFLRFFCGFSFFQYAVAGQCFHDALDDLAEQALQLLSNRWPHATEFRDTILDAVNAIKHQAMQRFPLVGKG